VGEVIGWLLSGALPWIIGIIGAIAAVFAIRYDAKSDAARDTRVKQAEDALATQQRINHADTSNGNADDDTRWLRDYAGKPDSGA